MAAKVTPPPPPGFVLDAPPPPPGFIPLPKDSKDSPVAKVAGMAEPLMSVGSGMAGDVVGGLAGLGSAALNQDSAKGVGTLNTVRNAMTYQPRTQTGQEGMARLGGILSPVTGFMQRAGEQAGSLLAPAARGVAGINNAIGGYGNPETAGAIATAAGQSFPTAAALLAGARVPAKNILSPTQSVQDATIQRGLQMGYKVPPKSAQDGLGNSVLQGISGKAATEQAASHMNIGKTDAVARRALKFKDSDPLTPQALASDRQLYGSVYQKVSDQPGKLFVDKQYKQDTADMAASIDQLAKDYPNTFKELGKEVADLKSDMLSGYKPWRSAVDFVKSTRERARGLWNADTPDKSALARSYSAAADAVDGLIQRNLQFKKQGSLYKDYMDARTQIAVNHSIEDALSEGTGHVSALALAKQLKQGRPLSGELHDVAMLGQAVPKALNPIAEAPSLSVTDYALAALLGASSKSPWAAAVLGARPAARASILSGPYQRSLVSKAKGTKRISPYLAAPLLAPSTEE